MNKNQKYIIKLSPRQKAQLHNITRKGKHNARVIMRARTLLESAKGLSAVKVASRVGTTDRTVERIRARFGEGGLDSALYDAPRPGQPPKLDDSAEAHLIAVACSDPPNEYDHWTLELLRERMIRDGKVKNISTVTLWNHLNDRQIKPWREKNVVRS